MRLSTESKSWRQKYQSAQSELDKLRQATATETEQAIAKAKAEGESAYLERWKTTAMVNAAQARLAEKGVTAIELAARSLDLHDVAFDPDTGRVDTAALDALYDAADGYPYFVQAYGKVTWDVAATSPITADDVAMAAPAAEAELAVGFFGSRYDRATPAEREYMHAMAELGGPAGAAVATSEVPTAAPVGPPSSAIACMYSRSAGVARS